MGLNQRTISMAFHLLFTLLRDDVRVIPSWVIRTTDLYSWSPIYEIRPLCGQVNKGFKTSNCRCIYSTFYFNIGYLFMGTQLTNYPNFLLLHYTFTRTCKLLLIKFLQIHPLTKKLVPHSGWNKDSNTVPKGILHELQLVPIGWVLVKMLMCWKKIDKRRIQLKTYRFKLFSESFNELFS